MTLDRCRFHHLFIDLTDESCLLQTSRQYNSNSRIWVDVRFLIRAPKMWNIEFSGYRSHAGLKKRRRRKRESKWGEKETHGRKRRALLEQNWPTKANLTLWEEEERPEIFLWPHLNWQWSTWAREDIGAQLASEGSQVIFQTSLTTCMCQSTLWSVSDGAAECETNNSSSLKVASV